MGCTNSALQGDSSASARTATKPTTPTTTNNPRKAQPASSYSTQPGRPRRQTTSEPTPGTSEAIPTPADAGIVSPAAAPAGNWTADRSRIRQDRMAYFRFKKPGSALSTPTSTERESLYGRQATSNEARKRREPGRRSLFP